MQCLHNYFFFKEENLLKFDEKAIGHRREKVKKEHVFINKFRGFKIDTFEYNNASNFKPLRYSTIQSLLKNNLYYTISPKQANLINIINNFRKKNNINQLKSNSAVKLIYYFDKIEHFFSLGNLFQFNNYKTYLFVYPIGEFEYKLRNNDDVIIKILKIKSLNYIIILEKENHKFEEIDMGTRNNYINLKGVKIPHFVFSSYYNLQVQSFIISKNLPFLECEVYEVKKELYFNIDPENEKNTKKKVKEFLDLNWKERANLISVIKSGNIRKSKENYDANCFEINRKFILSHGKIYIFLVTSSNKKVYAFNPRHITKDGVVIISKDDKALLSGFI
jgi:hypothetical protein